MSMLVLYLLIIEYAALQSIDIYCIVITRS